MILERSSRKRTIYFVMRLLAGVLLLIVLLWTAGIDGRVAAQTEAETLVVAPDGPYTTVTAALADAAEGDTIEVRGGTYAGPLLIDTSVRFVGVGWPVIEGGGDGTVVKITAAGVELRGFVVRNSGDSLDEENSGIAVEAPEATIANNRLEETLFGIYLREAPGSVIRGNTIDSRNLPVPRRGDAIRVWYSNDVLIEENVVRKGRDVVLWYSERLTVRGNLVAQGRYGLHFMYDDDALVEDNLLIENSVGAFLMYSRRLHLRHNTIASNRGPSGYGIGLKDMDDAFIEENLFVDNRTGAFVDNSPREVDSTVLFKNNVFAYNDYGLSLMPSTRRNQFTGNSFIENQEQVNVGGGGRLREMTWAIDGRGNYWSDYTGYDAAGDGVGDIPYKSEELFENLMDQNPELRLFIYSPAAQAVDFAARAFPFVKPEPKLTDPSPMMRPFIPQGLPTPARPDGRPLGVASGAMLLLALAMAFAMLAPRGKGDEMPDEETLPQPAPSMEQRRMRYDSERVPMIHVEDLTKRFGSVVAVQDLTFEVDAGHTVALWGANGAGKTTALRCLLGLFPYEGTVEVAGYDVAVNGKEARRYIGFVPQELNFHGDLTVRETMQFYARLKKVPAGVIDEHLARVGLERHGDKRVEELSGGMKQRLALAVALLADPPILLLDEPTANLDVRARDEFLHLLTALQSRGKTLIFSSHRLKEVLALADRILVLDDGRLVADCPPADLDRVLGLESRLKLYLPGDFVEPAISLLDGQGYQTGRNDQGIHVYVASQQKGRPIQLLAEQGIPVRDFEVEHPNSIENGVEE